MLLEVCTTEWSHRASRLSCHEDPLWSFAVFLELLCGPVWSFAVFLELPCGPVWSFAVFLELLCGPVWSFAVFSSTGVELLEFDGHFHIQSVK